MSKSAKIIGALLIILAIWAATSQGTKQSEAKVKIGVIAPLTGPFADYGEEIRRGVLAGSEGSGAEIVFEDEACDAKTTVSAFQKLTSIDGTHFIIGPGCGSPQEAIVPLLTSKDVVVIVPSAASNALYERSGKNFFNIQYSLEDESAFVADQMYAAGYRNVALITYGNAFSSAHATSFKAHFKGMLVADTVLLDDNANLLPELTKIKGKADAIYAPDVSFFFAGGMDRMKQLKLSLPVYTTYVAELPAVRPVVEGAFYSFPADIRGAGGGVYELSKEAVEVFIPTVKSCSADTECVKKKLSSGGFKDGVKVRPMTIKKIVNGEPVLP